MDGHAGPLTTRHTAWSRRLIWGLLARRRHRLLSATGPIVAGTTVMVWTLGMWAGWSLLFSADLLSLRHTHSGIPASGTDRIYFTGYTIFTLGNGDFTPQGPGWTLATALASLTGLILTTLAVTYLVSLLSGVVQKRSFASQVAALGESPEEFVIHSWSGTGFPALELQLLSLTEQLNVVAERYEAYPILHYYHAAHDYQSVPRSLAVFDDALTLLAEGVREDSRPSPAALHCARESVRLFLDTMGSSYVARSREPPPALPLERLRAAGIPTATDAEFAARVARLEDRRRLIGGFLEGERRAWPVSRTVAGLSGG